MTTSWALDRIRLTVPARQPARTLGWAALPWVVLAAVLLVPGICTRYPDPTYSTFCWPATDTVCRQVEPLLDGERWPSTWTWQTHREVALRAGAAEVEARPELPLDHPDNVAFLKMAARVPTSSLSRAIRPDDASRRAAIEAIWLTRLQERTHEQNIARALETDSFDAERRGYAKRFRRNGWIVFFGVLLVGGPLALRTTYRRLGDLGAIDLEVTAHQVRLDGHTFDRSQVVDLRVVGARIQLRLRDGTVRWSSPLPTSEVDEADEVCVAFAALDPEQPGATVPAALRSLLEGRADGS